MAEQLIRNEQVDGSIPFTSSRNKPHVFVRFLFYCCFFSSTKPTGYRFGGEITDKYMTPQQAAEKWGISRRTVRQYLASDRIEGIVCVNGRTLIPASAEKPADRRRRQSGSAASDMTMNPFVLTTSSYTPGTAERTVNETEDAARRMTGLAELAYLRGDADTARELCKKLNASEKMEIRLGALLIDLLATLFKESGTSSVNSFRDLQMIAKIASEHPKYRKTGELFGLYLNITVHNRADTVFPDPGLDAFSMPHELKPMAVYAYSRWLLIDGKIGRAIGLAEGALIFMTEICPVEAVYLSLTVAYGYVLSGNRQKAEYFFRYARSIAEPDGILAPFAEFRYLLAGLTEKCMRTETPETYKKILELSTVYFKNWINIHNSLTGDTVSSKLSPTEFNVAMLAARNVSNTDIAEYMNISVNSVRTHLRNIFNKLNIYSRKELLDYVIH